jgi:hypothetical protein
VADDLRNDPDVGPHITGAMEIDGVEKMEAASMVVRARLPVMPATQVPVRRQFLRCMKVLAEERQATQKLSAG